MLPDAFKRTLETFADSPADVDLSKGSLIVQVRDEVIEAKLVQREGELWVEEDGERRRATSWLIQRVARLPLLADRLLAYVPEIEHFVAPSGNLLDQPDYHVGEDDLPVADALTAIRDLLDRKPGGTTTITYLTSDAGEGKTTLINQLARQQAQRYKSKETDWLLVPITLGGRAFLRLDDVVVAALVNRLRFPVLYYEAFLELVKLGVVVPALDGFEEMFIESSSGEAISALGNLVRSLNSSGSVLIAARKAYFEYQSLGTQARLLDGMGGSTVAFSRLALNRWDMPHFLEYARKRKAPDAIELYDVVRARFGAQHPLLTRAVLVRRLLDVAGQHADADRLVAELGSAPQDYFFQFVNAIVEREATEKWIDRSGEPYKPLLSTAEHHDLLALVAQEMWLSAADSLKVEIIEVVAEMYSDSTGRSPVVARQITERLKQHSLLTNVSGAKATYAFDHEDFRKFYLGEALGRAMLGGDHSDLRRFVQPAAIPPETAEAAAHYVCRGTHDLPSIVARLQRLASEDTPSSFTKENAGLIALRLLTLADHQAVTLKEMSFPADVLRGQRLSSVTFASCYFQPSSLEGTSIAGCTFVHCRFDRLEFFDSTHVQGSHLDACEVGNVVLHETDEHLFDPRAVQHALLQAGFLFPAPVQPDLPLVMDEEVRLAERALRVFLRANQINDAVFKQKLVGRYGHFNDVILPELIRQGVVEEIPYRGAGMQRRFRLRVQMQRLQAALAKSGGSFERFLAQLRN